MLSAKLSRSKFQRIVVAVGNVGVEGGMIGRNEPMLRAHARDHVEERKPVVLRGRESRIGALRIVAHSRCSTGFVLRREMAGGPLNRKRKSVIKTNKGDLVAAVSRRQIPPKMALIAGSIRSLDLADKLTVGIVERSRRRQRHRAWTLSGRVGA
jgi:hypothetical protein